MQDYAVQVHRVLEYLLTKAVISGKPLKTSVRIPYSQLAAEVGKNSYKDIDLVVKIVLKWDEHQAPTEDVNGK